MLGLTRREVGVSEAGRAGARGLGYDVFYMQLPDRVFSAEVDGADAKRLSSRLLRRDVERRGRAA